MADDIEVHYVATCGALSLTCGDDAFLRVRDAIIAAAGLDEMAIDGVPAGVRTIAVNRVQTPPVVNRRADRVALLGCAVIGFAVLFVLIVGVQTIVKWMR